MMEHGQMWQGDALAQMQRIDQSIELYRQAPATYQKCTPASDDTYAVDVNAVSHLKIGSILLQENRPEAAFMEYQKALDLGLPAANETNPQAIYTSAEAYAGLADVERMRALHTDASTSRLTHLKQARDLYRKSQVQWNRISNPGAMSPSGFLCETPRHALRALTETETALSKAQDSRANGNSSQIN